MVEGQVRLSARLEERGIDVVQTGMERRDFSRYISQLLTEGMLREASSQRAAIVEWLGEVRENVPYVVAEVLREYFHIMVQERGVEDEQFVRIFDRSGEPLWIDWEVMGRLGKLRSDRDHSHGMILERIEMHLSRNPLSDTAFW